MHGIAVRRPVTSRNRKRETQQEIVHASGAIRPAGADRARPQWLTDAHATLNAAVASAYGWPADISDDDGLRELLALNLAQPLSAVR